MGTQSFSGKVILVGSHIHRKRNIHDHYFDVWDSEAREKIRAYYALAEMPTLYQKVQVGEKVTVSVDTNVKFDDGQDTVKNNLTSFEMT